MITQITEHDFIDSQALRDHFTYYARIALFEYFKQIEDDLDMQIELDPIAIMCEWTEYPDLDEITKTYPDIKSLDDLYYNTQVIEFDQGIIIQDF